MSPLTPRTPDGTPIAARHVLELGRSKFLRTDDNSEEMAVNGVASGTPVVIWNGTGVGDTGGDWTHTFQGTETAESMYAGTNGMDSGVRTVGQQTGFDFGSNQDIDGMYDTVSFWMQPKAYPGGSQLRVLWKTSGGNNPGNVLNVADYIDNFDIDTWQLVTIPIEDFDLGDDVAKFFFTYASQGGQHFWFDDIELNTSAGDGPYTFRISAPANTVYHVDSLKILVVAGDSGWNSDSFADIVSGLVNGILIRHNNIGTSPEVLWSIVAKNNMDLFGYLGSIDDVSFADNKQLFIFLLKPQIATIDVTDENVLDILIRDNLSSLVKMRAFLYYGIEEVPV